ncbi:hypothetical protein MKZ38_001634 [Zalerion maritima]|uniref:Ketoreductase domain-containing protein n=1 Tax=Zalerion maritima TaxID=339359 RepID=A0AAD5WTQ1_9PEZI|nr:hypothetical protein MKZ38_001634 [Zalerion maritima]
MSNYSFPPSELEALRGKVVLITGAAAGIGRAIAGVAHRYGAKVAACDVDDTRGQEMVEELKERILYKHCDVSDWSSVVNFFKETYQHFGPIDAVISNAGINKVESFDDVIDTETGELKAPDLSLLKVNAIGTWYVTKCAVHYFKKHPTTKSQLVLFGSVASIFDTPPLYTYCASKAAVLGLMRALRTQLPKDNITVNMIAPWMTLTPMATDHIRSVWGDLPANTTENVAVASLMPVARPEINGKTFLINGGCITELEDKLDETQSIWLGPELDKHMREGQPLWLRTASMVIERLPDECDV